MMRYVSEAIPAVFLRRFEEGRGFRKRAHRSARPASSLMTGDDTGFPGRPGSFEIKFEL